MASEFTILRWAGQASDPKPVHKAPKAKPVAPVVEAAPRTVDAASLFSSIKTPEPEIPPISAKPLLPPVDDDLPPAYSKPVEQDALSRTTDPLAPADTEVSSGPEVAKTGRGRRTYRSGRGT